MRIEFPAGQREWNGGELTVDFAAKIDGAPVVCSISVEALQDHFGAASTFEEDVLTAFDSGAKRIHSLCRRALEGTDGDPVVLRSGLIRVLEA